MLPLTTLTTLVNSLTLVMTLGFFIIIIWHDRSKEQNQFFALFLFAVVIWSSGTLLLLASSAIGIESGIQIQLLASGIIRVGFAASIVAIYGFTAILVSVRPRFFRTFVGITLLLIILYQTFIEQRFSRSIDAGTLYRSGIGTYIVFGATTLYLLWRYRARVPSYTFRWGIFAFVVGQGISAIDASDQTLAVSIMVSSSAVLVLGLSLLQLEIIMPLRDRNSQVEAMHSMSLAVTSQLSVQTVMRQIVRQAEQWLKADAVGLFLKEQDRIKLVEVAGLPRKFVDITLPAGEGVAGAVITNRKTILLENYASDWKREPDLPLALDTFGAVVCVPLVSADESIGALMVISGKHSRSFDAEDVYLLEMLGAQAAVAITHGQYFNTQQRLTQKIEQARNQLETVLASTENPVIAINRRLEVIFVNVAAERLFPILKYTSQSITEVIPEEVLPPYLTAYRSIKKTRAYTYEILHQDRAYLCHLAAIGQGYDIEGWVAVLNDVTELKELDRIKSEMVRMTSHDLKNPLQAALAHTELIGDVLEDFPDEDIMESVGVIEKQLSRMYRIISGVLDVERLRSGQQTLLMVSPSKVVKNTVSDFHAVASGKDITLNMEIAPDVQAIMGDPGQIERALSNLVENAIKFTPHGGNIDVKAYTEKDHTILMVRDNGIGIPEHDQTRVFDSFFRANQRGAEHISGTGLGLHLVKTVTENHGGRVWLESDSTGTAFYISIPSATDSMMTGHIS